MESVQLIPAKAAALILGISVHTLKRWRRSAEGPEWCRVGRRAIRYRSDVLDKWLRSVRNPASPTSEKFGGSNVTWNGTGIIPMPEKEF